MGNRIRRRNPALLVLAALLAGDCTHPANQAAATRAAPAGPPAGSPVTRGAVPLPIERYLLTDGQLNQLIEARNQLAARCLSRFGLTWDPAPPPTPRDASLDAANSARRYGLTDPGAAARLGYHQAGPAQAKPPQEPALSSAQQTVLTGSGPDGRAVPGFRGRPIPAGGCIGEANARISGDPAHLGDDDLAGRINVDSYQQSMADPRVVAAFKAWSGCMKQRGYDYADPTRLPGPGPEFTGPEPTRAEIAVAVADVSCKQSTRLVAIWSGVDAADQDAAIKQHAADLARVEQDLREQLRNAAAVSGR